MNTISRRFSAAVALVLCMAAWAGCEFIAAVDRNDIPGGGNQGGGSNQGGGGGGNQGGGGASNQGGGGSGNQGGSGGAEPEVLLISEVRTRGDGGPDDEFVELYNPTSAAITTSSSWRLEVREAIGNTCPNSDYVSIWAGSGETVPSHGHLLIASSGYTGPPDADATEMGGSDVLIDAASIVLIFNNNDMDALCFAYDAQTTDNLTNCTNPAYRCEGTPATNPHNASPSTNTPRSLERAPGGTDGNGTDSGDSSADFAEINPAQPQNTSSPATP